MKLMQACLSARKDGESSFHHCVGLVMLVQACLNARGDRESIFSLVWRQWRSQSSLITWALGGLTPTTL